MPQKLTVKLMRRPRHQPQNRARANQRGKQREQKVKPKFRRPAKHPVLKQTVPHPLNHPVIRNVLQTPERLQRRPKDGLRDAPLVTGKRLIELGHRLSICSADPSSFVAATTGLDAASHAPDKRASRPSRRPPLPSLEQTPTYHLHPNTRWCVQSAVPRSPSLLPFGPPFRFVFRFFLGPLRVSLLNLRRPLLHVRRAQSPAGREHSTCRTDPFVL